MTFKSVIPEKEGVYFIALTCARALPLFAIADSYTIIYRWFNRLKRQKNYVVGYVILPDRLYAVIAFTRLEESISGIINNGKKIMARNIIRSLRQKNAIEVLQRTLDGKKETNRTRHAITEVFKRSFQCIECVSQYHIKKKLDYLHNSPCSYLPKLSRYPAYYEHSSARYYLNQQSKVAYPVTSFMKLEEIGLILP